MLCRQDFICIHACFKHICQCYEETSCSSCALLVKISLFVRGTHTWQAFQAKCHQTFCRLWGRSLGAFWHIRTYRQTGRQAGSQADKNTYIRVALAGLVPRYTCMHACILHASTHPYIYTYTRTLVHACMQTYVYTYTATYVHRRMVVVPYIHT